MAVSTSCGYHDDMEGLIERLLKIGIEPEIITAIRADGEAGRETALALEVKT